MAPMTVHEEQSRLLGAGASTSSDATVSVPSLRRIQLALYGSYMMAAWAWRGMEFTIALVLIELYPESLLLVSLYGLLDNGMTVTLGSAVGGYIDRAGRWRGARNCYTLQNVCVAGAGLSLVVVLAGWVGTPGNPDSAHQAQYWATVGAALLLSALSSVASRGVSIAVEKRMPQLLCSPSPAQQSKSDPAISSADPAGDQGAAAGTKSAAESRDLAAMNSVFRAIDLSCLLASPMASGILMTYSSPLAAVLLLVGYCLVAWVPELLLLHWVVHASPQLREVPHPPHPPSFSSLDSDTEALPTSTPPSALSGKQGDTSDDPSFKSSGGPDAAADDSCIAGWVLYFRQPVLLANLSLALLYMTVLSLGFLMTSYLKWSGMTEAEISVFRGIGAITGLAATAVYPILHRNFGAVRSGVVGIYYQFACLLIGVVPVLATITALGAGEKPAVWQARVLIGSVVASRSGLWMFDLAVTQIVQDRVAQNEMGTVCGVQSSIQAGFETASFVAGTIVTDPSEFWILMLGSLVMVSLAVALYTVFVASRPGACGTGYSQLPRQEEQQLKAQLLRLGDLYEQHWYRALPGGPPEEAI